MGSEEFQGFKVIDARPFSKETFKALTSAARCHTSTQISEVLEKLGCSTILVEENYVDRDYKAEFSAFYSKRFHTPSPRCVRLHFFLQVLKKYGAIDTPEKFEELEGKSYLGFCVVRPTEFNRIGRTVIKPLISGVKAKGGTISYYVTCQVTFVTHLFGRRFKVTGSPFVQQDTQVGVCAHAALWTVGRYMSNLGYCEETLPPDVNDLATARQPRGRIYPADAGLVTSQMLDALHGMGLSAIHYGRSEISDQVCKHLKMPTDALVAGENEENQKQLKSKKLADIAYRYIESRLPVILTTEQHAFVAVGHTFKQTTYLTNTIDQIPSFIINDDSRGPYLELPLKKSVENSNSIDNIEDVIAILPASAKLRGEYAEEYARTALELLPEILNSNSFKAEASRLTGLLADFRLRTYLIRASEFQYDLWKERQQKNTPLEIVDSLIRLDYPQYIWISEVFVQNDWENQVCLGKIIIDSTAAKLDKSIMAIFMGKIIMLFDRQHPKASPLILSSTVEFQLSPKLIATK